MGLFSKSRQPEGIPGRGVVVYYGHGTKETGSEVDKSANLRVKVDVRTRVGDADQVTTVKQFLRGDLAWLLEEGLEVPLRVDPESGLPLRIDPEALESELESHRSEVKDAHDDQTSLGYSFRLFQKRDKT